MYESYGRCNLWLDDDRVYCVGCLSVLGLYDGQDEAWIAYSKLGFESCSSLPDYLPSCLVWTGIVVVSGSSPNRFFFPCSLFFSVIRSRYCTREVGGNSNATLGSACHCLLLYNLCALCSGSGRVCQLSSHPNIHEARLRVLFVSAGLSSLMSIVNWSRCCLGFQS